MSWLTSTIQLEWLFDVNWSLVQTLIEIIVAIAGGLIYKKYKKVVLRSVLSFKREKNECDVSISMHRCLVLSREREMIISSEAKPFFELINLLNNAGIKTNVLYTDKASELDEIHVGGPVSNRHTNRYFCQYIQNIQWLANASHVAQYKEDEHLQTFNFDYLCTSDSAEGFNVDGKLYKYIKNQEGWAFVIRINLSEDASPKTIHLLFGCGTNGTIGAVNYFLRNYFSMWRRNIWRKDYIGVFKVDRDGNKIGKIEWLDAKKFIQK